MYWNAASVPIDNRGEKLMKEKNNLGLAKINKVNNSLINVIKTPKWIEVTNRQQQIFNSGIAMAASLQTAISVLPVKTMVLNSCTSGLNTFKYALDTTKFDPVIHTPAWQQNISSVISALSASMPNTTKIMDFPRLNAFECETAKVLNSAGISTQMIMPSLQIMESLQSFAHISSSISTKVDMVLATSQLLTTYSALVEKQYTQIQKDITNSTKHLQVIELATKLVQDQIISTGNYIASEAVHIDEEIHEENISSNTKTIIQYIPAYLGYALRDNSNYDLEEELNKSIILQISENGKNLVTKIQYINELRVAQGEEYVFKPTNKMFTASSCLTTSLAVDQSTFGNVIDSLYMLIYEGSGYAKRILGVLTDEESTTLWDIKKLRTDFRHDIEHGTEKDIQKKEREIGNAYKTLCGKARPLKQKDWVTTQYNLFLKVNELLDLIIEKISNTEESEPEVM